MPEVKSVASAGSAATMPAAGLFARRSFAGTRRCKRGKFLVQLAGATMRTFRSIPVGRTHQDFAVTSALLTMKFVDWHV